MSVVVLEDVCLGFGKQTLFDNLSLRVADGDRIGLIGPNGSGKTSLLRLIAADQTPDSGKLEFRRGTRVGYLPQELEGGVEKTARDYVIESVQGRSELQAELEAAEREMELRVAEEENGQAGPGSDTVGAHGVAEKAAAEARSGPSAPAGPARMVLPVPDESARGRKPAPSDGSAAVVVGSTIARLRQSDTMDVAGRLASLHERLLHYDVHYSEHEALSILAGLGFSPGDLDRPLEQLSGGWRMRAILASLLFQQPDLLLLDEPTNHLDMPTVAWFADFLARYKRAFILICHDRDFLNEQISRVISIEQEAVRQFSGNYEQYVKQRVEEEQVLENKAKNLQRQREQAERFIARNRARKDRAKQVQSRIRSLEKMQSVDIYRKRRVMHFSFPSCARAGQEVVRLKDVTKRYGDNVVFNRLDLRVQRGERIGVIGPNGAGKTTLLKLMAGEARPESGTVKLGYNVEAGYFAQHLSETLNRNATVYEEVAARGPDAGVTHIRTLLGSFLFSGDDVDKKVAILSGGERSRVALARLLINPGNLLLMDEPTNHLDLESSESLADSLSTYDGTLIFVSHNRSLIRRLASRIWHVDNGEVETYPGILDEYLDSCRRRLAAPGQPDVVTAEKPAAQRGKKPPPRAVEKPKAAGAGKRTRAENRERKRLEALLREERSRRLSSLRSRVSELEEEIFRLEELQKERSALLADPGVYADKERSTELIRSFNRDKQRLEELTEQWERAQARLEG
jgi:ATP-binding cassette subfamily F protein 3